MADSKERKRPTTADFDELEFSLSEAIFACDLPMQREVCEYGEHERLDIAPLLNPSLGKRVMGDRVCGLAKRLLARFPKLRSERVANAVEKVFGKRPKKLSSTAKLVLENLEFRQNKNEDCWPSQQKLAEDIGVQERQIRRCLAELVKAGCVEVTRPSMTRGNRYRVLIGPKELLAKKKPPGENVRCDRSTTTSVTGQKCPVPQVENDLCDRAKMSGVHEKEIEKQNETQMNGSSEEGSAAADLCASLRKYGITENEEAIVRGDPKLGAIALEHLQTRVADTTKKPIGAGYAQRALLQRPADFGLRRSGDGTWSNSPDPAQERIKQRAEEKRRQAAADPVARCATARLTRWQDLTSEQQHDIIHEVAEKRPEIRMHGPQFREECFDVMETRSFYAARDPEPP